MIKVYKNGKDFIDENFKYLETNKYMSTFFFFDAPLLKESTKINYAIKVEEDNKILLALKVEPYNLLLFGDDYCLDSLLNYLIKENYIFDGIMCSSSIGNRLLEISSNFYQSLGLDFMEAKNITEESSEEVIVATEKDIDEIFEMTSLFINECGLGDTPNKEGITKFISRYRIIRVNDKIVSMAAYSANNDESFRITYVYTRPSFRGKGYARKVVNRVKNDIIKNGKIATLNVDQKNPISNHLYKSLGFNKIFSQGIYLKK